jgi:hypothetical protein
MTKCLGISCGGLCRSTKSHQSTLPSLRICTIMLWQVFKQSDGDTNDFPINIWPHQWSALSPYLFALVMNEVTRDIQCDIPWCMLFVDDFALVDESRTGVNQKLELWRWQKVLGLVGLKWSMWSVISVLPHKGREMLDLMVRWYSRKTPFATCDQCSKRMGISMKMLVIELKLTG